MKICALLFALPLLAACPDKGAEPTPTPIPTPTATADALPGPVTNLTATVNGDVIDLAWTNPGDADLSGVLLVARAGEQVIYFPRIGSTHALGDQLGDNQVVGSVDLVTSTTTPPIEIGTDYHFAAWAIDAIGQYSEEAAHTNATRVALGSQTATLSLDLAGNTATVLQQPEDFTLDIGGFGFDLATQTAWLDLGVTNQIRRIVFNLKAVTDAMTAGTQDGSTFWVENDKPYTYFGPEALAPAVRFERRLDFSGLDGTADPVLMDLHFVDAPMVYGGTRDVDMMDTSMSGEFHWTNSDRPSAADGGYFRQSAMSRDGHYLYLTEKNSGVLQILDTTTLEWTANAQMSQTGANAVATGGVGLSPDGKSIYVAFIDGDHWRGYKNGNADVYMLELDAVSLFETRRTWLYRTASNTGESPIPHALALSPDGSTIAIAAGNKDADLNELWFFDVATFAPIDTDTTTAEADPLSLPSPGQATYCMWDDTTNTVVVAFNTYDNGPYVEHSIDLVDPVTYGVTTVGSLSGQEAASTSAVRDGKAFISSRNSVSGGDRFGITIIDLATGVATPVSLTDLSPDVTTNYGTGLVLDPAKELLWWFDYGDAYAIDLDTMQILDGDGDSSNGVTRVRISDVRAGYVNISPF